MRFCLAPWNPLQIVNPGIQNRRFLYRIQIGRRMRKGHPCSGWIRQSQGAWQVRYIKPRERIGWVFRVNVAPHQSICNRFYGHFEFRQGFFQLSVSPLTPCHHPTFCYWEPRAEPFGQDRYEVYLQAKSSQDLSRFYAAEFPLQGVAFAE